MTSKERVSTGTDQPRIHSETENKPSVGKKKEATSVRNTTTTFNHYDHYNSPSSDLYLSEDPSRFFFTPVEGRAESWPSLVVRLRHGCPVCVASSSFKEIQ